MFILKIKVTYFPDFLVWKAVFFSVRFHVLEIEESKIILSLRRSHLGKPFDPLPELPEDAKPDREIATVSDLREGEVVRGYVKAVGNAGVFIRLEIFPYTCMSMSYLLAVDVLWRTQYTYWNRNGKSFQYRVSLYRLGREVTGRVMITNISDRFIKNYQSVVLIGELVRVKVIG